MLLNKAKLSGMFLAAAALWRDNIALLSDIDSRFGDGDHGVTIGKIATLFTSSVEGWGDASLHDFIETLGEDIMSIGGGSAGPLYGSLIGGLAVPLGTEESIDGPMLKKMLAASLEEMFDLTTARAGAKTMMDALIPAVQAAGEAEGDVADILLAAAKAAEEGARATQNMVSKFGRARSYGEQTLGTPDAGAVSTSLLFRGLCNGALA
ncbi:dihydroxyacetone kinase subunit L [Desulfovibrio sp. OttesenSCG-928-I05]|nr:dihydroxyacetone kinase subunit L [Desulfovibrio sp. OttesenSCG-928-I05]